MSFMTIGLKKTVSLVLLPIDDFTDRVIMGSQLHMYTEEGKRPSIRKADGYHVFCDLPGSTARICIEGPLYQKQTIELSIGDASKVYQVRLLPSANYPIPGGATCVRGSLEPGSRLRLFFPEQKKSYKLLYDYEPEKQENNLPLFCPEQVRLEGKTFYIKESEKWEFFRIMGQQGEFFQLEEPLQRSYKKIGTSVYPVLETFAGEDGSFYLPIRSIQGESCRCICMIAGKDGQEEIQRELTLVEGRENRITEAIYKKEEEC